MASIREVQLSVIGSMLAGAVLCAQEPTRPAVRLLPAQAMSPIEAMTVRAAEPKFDPLAVPDGRATSRNDAPRMREIFNQTKDAETPSKPGPWKKFTKWVDDKASGMKKKMDAPPADQPPPRVGQAPPMQSPVEQKSTLKGGLREFFSDKPISPPTNTAAVPNPGNTRNTPTADANAQPGFMKRLFNDKPATTPNPAPAATNNTPNATPANGSEQPGFIKRLFKDEPQSPPKPPEGPKVSTANPAFRWYGYGSTTPGQNAFAPTGDYPNGSAQWYQQSGATPGAFPVPTMNPLRPAPGADMPAYIPGANTSPPAAATFVPPIPSPGMPTPGVPTFAPPTRRTIAETPARPVPTVPNVVTPPSTVPTVPTVQTPIKQEPTWRPVVTMPASPAPTTAPVMMKEPVKAPEPAWKPLDTQNVIVPVIRGSAPDLDDSPMAKRVKAACEGLATKVTIRETGPRQLVIRFEAKSTALAEATAKAIAALLELQPYSIDFQAGVPKAK